MLAAALFGLATLPGIVSAQESGQEQGKQVGPPGFDYWQPEWMTRELWGPGRMPKSMMARLLRPHDVRELRRGKGVRGRAIAIHGQGGGDRAGAKLYTQNCAACHGSNGLGNGDMGKALSPSPALLAYMIRRPIAVDEYLLWTISEGGKQFGTDMPPSCAQASRSPPARSIVSDKHPCRVGRAHAA